MSWRQLCRQFRKNRAAEISLYLIVGFIVTAVLAEALSPYDPFTLGDDTLLGPSAGHWMGTDDLGRDTFSRVIYGARVPLLVGFLATATSMLLGILIGSFSGYFGGRTDVILMRATEYVLVVPRFFLALLVVAMLGTGVMKIVLVIGLLGWPEVARVVRAQFLTLREREFVLAARAIGASHLKVIFGEILPNALPPAVVVASILVARAILLEAGLSFLGLGDPNLISWGSMIGASRVAMWVAWWTTVLPGLCIMITVLALNFIGDGLNDALNPRRRR